MGTTGLTTAATIFVVASIGMAAGVVLPAASLKLPVALMLGAMGVYRLVRHSHFTVNGRKANIPSHLVKIGDVIALREKSRKSAKISEALEAVARRGVPSWLDLQKEQFQGRVAAFPTREDLTMPIKEQLIVELYSK